MKLTTFTQYGLRSLVRLAILQGEGNKWISVKQVAEIEGMSDKYIEPIFSTLRENGFVKASKGRYGGYRLNKPSEDINVHEVVMLLDKNLQPLKMEGMEILETMFKVVDLGIADLLKDVTIDDLINNLKK